MSSKKFYRCNTCGNLFGVINDSGMIPICCGSPMESLQANSVDAAVEKHVPVIEKSGDTVKVTVGSTLHPMLDEHYIQWIIINQGDITQRKALKPGDEPIAVFKVADATLPVTSYEYCNLHGLWTAEE